MQRACLLKHHAASNERVASSPSLIARCSELQSTALLPRLLRSPRRRVRPTALLCSSVCSLHHSDHSARSHSLLFDLVRERLQGTRLCGHSLTHFA